jgi:hypothetical protein
MKAFYGLFLFIPFIVFLTGFPAWSEPVTPEQAALAVERWLAFDPQPLGETPGALPLLKVSMYGSAGEVFSFEQALYYAVFLRPRGIVFVPADDRIEPIFALQPDAASFDPSARTPFHSLVIEALKKHAEAARENAVQGIRLSDSETSDGEAEEALTPQIRWNWLLSSGRFGTTSRSPQTVENPEEKQWRALGASALSDVRVAPLLQSSWGQSDLYGLYLYNYHTPKHYPAGCVATAAAQVMRYFRHPASTVEKKVFSCSVDGALQWKTLWGGPYEWDAMPLQPDRVLITDREREATGRLLFDVGLAVRSKYAFDETASSVVLAYKRLTDTFGYSHAVYAATGQVDTGILFPVGRRKNSSALIILLIKKNQLILIRREIYYGANHGNQQFHQRVRVGSADAHLFGGFRGLSHADSGSSPDPIFFDRLEGSFRKKREGRCPGQVHLLLRGNGHGDGRHGGHRQHCGRRHGPSSGRSGRYGLDVGFRALRHVHQVRRGFPGRPLP